MYSARVATPVIQSRTIVSNPAVDPTYRNGDGITISAASCDLVADPCVDGLGQKVTITSSCARRAKRSYRLHASATGGRNIGSQSYVSEAQGAGTTPRDIGHDADLTIEGWKGETSFGQGGTAPTLNA